MRPGLLIRLLVALVLGVGVACQFIQHTDPVFPLTYFTVDSALLAALVAWYGLIHPAEPPRLAIVRGAAAVGVVLSGLMYAAVIAPSSPTGTWFQPGDDPWVRTATVLMHGIGPFLVVADFLTHAYPDRLTWGEAARWVAWPVAYILVMLAVQATGVASIPYAFLQPARMGGVLVVIGVAAVVAVVYLLLGRVLLAAKKRVSAHLVRLT